MRATFLKINLFLASREKAKNQKITSRLLESKIICWWPKSRYFPDEILEFSSLCLFTISMILQMSSFEALIILIFSIFVNLVFWFTLLTMSDMVKFRAALWSFLKLTACALYFIYHVWQGPLFFCSLDFQTGSKFMSDYMLKVSQFRNVFLVSSILPKKERKQFNLRYHSRKVKFFLFIFWMN